MTHYRITLHGEDDSVVRELHLRCEDDDDAIDRAAALDHPLAIRVWDGTSLIVLFTQRHPASSNPASGLRPHDG